MGRWAAAITVTKTKKPKQGADDIKYRFVFKRWFRWCVGNRVGFRRVLGMYDTAKIAAEAAAAAWNVELSSLVKNEPVASRPWTATHYRWIYQRGLSYVLRCRENHEDFVKCSTNLEELVAFGMLRWGLTRDDMTKTVHKASGHAVHKGAAVQPSDEEDVPATQPYPEEVLIAPEGNVGNDNGGDNDSRPSSTTDWGAAKYVAATLANDPNMLPGDIADLEGRAAGHMSKLQCLGACLPFRWHFQC